MKHIFISHSWITQLTAEATINYKKIPKRDVLFINNRNFLYEIGEQNYKKVRIRKIPFNGIINSLLMPIRYIRFINWLNTLTGNQEYILYAPHFIDFSYRIIGKYKKCKEINLIEEGIKSFRTLEDISTRFYSKRKIPTIIKFLEDFNIIDQLKVFPFHTKNTFKISDKAFNEFSQAVNVKEELNSLIKGVKIQPDIQVVLALGAFVDGHQKMSLELYCSKLKGLLRFLVSKYSEPIYYKHHPSDSKIVKDNLKIIFQEFNGRVILLEDNISLELVIIKNRPALITFNCSIAIYALENNSDLYIATHWINDKVPFLKISSYDFKKYYLPIE